MKQCLSIYCCIVGSLIVCAVLSEERKHTGAESESEGKKSAHPLQEEKSVTDTGSGEKSKHDGASSQGDNSSPRGRGIFSSEEREEVADPNLALKKDKADEYFKKGTVLYDGGDYASAAQAFLVAYETLPHQAVLGNIALCYDKAGKIPAATVYYRRYLAKPVSSDKNDYMATRLKELETLVGTLVVACPESERACQIRVNGIARGKGDVEVVVMPGEQRIEGFVDSVLIDSRVLEIGTQETLTITLNEKDTQGEEALPVFWEPKIQPLPEPSEGLKPSLGVWVALGSSVLSGALVGVFGGLTLKLKSDFDNEEDLEKKEELGEKGDRFKLITNIFIGVTGAAVVTTVLLIVNDFKDRKKRNSIALTGGGTDLGIGIAVSF
jgi:hypothetical protein